MEEAAERGEAIYEREIRSKVESEHDGEFVVIDIATGEYSVSDNELAAFESAERKNPDGFFYVKRVGRKAVHRIGGTRVSPGPSR
jgi:hypothetical protein